MASEIIIALIVVGFLVVATAASAIVRWAAGKTGRLAENVLGTGNVQRIGRIARFVIGPPPVESDEDDDNYPTDEPAYPTWLYDIDIWPGSDKWVYSGIGPRHDEDEVIAHWTKVRGETYDGCRD